MVVTQGDQTPTSMIWSSVEYFYFIAPFLELYLCFIVLLRRGNRLARILTGVQVRVGQKSQKKGTLSGGNKLALTGSKSVLDSDRP